MNVIRFANHLKILDIPLNVFQPVPDSNSQSIDMNFSFPSKNFNDRLLGPPFMLVIHDTEANLTESIKILTGKTVREVSVHYIVDTDGKKIIYCKD